LSGTPAAVIRPRCAPDAPLAPCERTDDNAQSDCDVVHGNVCVLVDAALSLWLTAPNLQVVMIERR
jgi:hypothetical protein